MTLDLDALLSEARVRAGGLTDFGDARFRPAAGERHEVPSFIRIVRGEVRVVAGRRIAALLVDRVVIERQGKRFVNHRVQLAHVAGPGRRAELRQRAC